MNRKTILLGWEMGAGIGYSVQLRELALALQKQGHSPVVALRSIESANQLFASCDFPVVQAPYVIGRLTRAASREGFFPASFADMMACNGFGSEDHLYSMVRGWRDLIDVVKPDLVVGRYCPLLTMAAYGRIPVVLFGPGYSTPPADNATFPAFSPDTRAYSSQSKTLEIVQSVQDRFRAAVPACLTEIYRGDVRIITTLPELDPYRICRTDTCAGPFERYSTPQAVHGNRFYAYLAGATDTTFLVAQTLIESGMSGSLFVRDADEHSWRLQATEAIAVHPRAPNLLQVTRDAAVLVHHGGLGTVHAGLAAGRPQVLVPQVFDQMLTADALSEFPFIVSIIGNVTSEEITTAVQSLLGNREIESSAMEYALSIQSRGLHNAQDKIMTASLKLLQ